MNEYEFTLKEGSIAKISFSPHFDNLISKSKGKKVLESVFLMD